MTEAELLHQLRSEFEAAAQEIDTLANAAKESAWSIALDDNGWTTGQIVAHVALAARAYQDILPGVLQRAQPSNGSTEVKHPTVVKMIIRALRRGKAPAPAKSVVTQTVSMTDALAEWHSVRDHMRGYLDAAQGKDITSEIFRNPFIQVIKMNAADALTVLVAHLSYHRPQLVRRLGGESSSS